MAPQHQLPFEKPIYDLEEQLEKLESEPDPSPALKDSIRRMRVELTQITLTVEDISQVDTALLRGYRWACERRERWRRLG